MLEIVATKDTVIGAYMQPFYAHNKEDAKRNWGQSIYITGKQEDKALLIKDYQLYSLGTFNDETGEIIPKVEYLAKAQDYLEVKPCSIQKVTDQKQ